MANSREKKTRNVFTEKAALEQEIAALHRPRGSRSAAKRSKTRLSRASSGRTRSTPCARRTAGCESGSSSMNRLPSRQRKERRRPRARIHQTNRLGHGRRMS
ncbi:hypothetical protein, partial [Mitsuokella multacida]|uniref:hypothetical protein n=1 Tax=Mitsuokella multacida TaxID=52226 RepID=UPI003FEF52CC